jgi:hypothetical protein
MLSDFSEIWFVDFEFEAKDGHCGKVIRLFEEELRSRVRPPYARLRSCREEKTGGQKVNYL